MKRSAIAAAALLLGLAGCGATWGAPAPQVASPAPEATPAAVQTEAQALPSAAPATTGDQASTSPAQTASPGAGGSVDGDAALAIALDNAGVPEEDAYNVKVETDEDNGIPIYDIEFETGYGDYDFEVAIDGGAIVGADYEVDEAWLDTLGGSPVTLEQAKSIVQAKVPGAELEDIAVWEESDDGRGRYEGELFSGGLKYEFEIDPQTGTIYDWNADLRS